MRGFCEECARRREQEAAGREARESFEEEFASEMNRDARWIISAIVLVLAACSMAGWHDARGRAEVAALKASHDRRKAPHAGAWLRPLEASP